MLSKKEIKDIQSLRHKDARSELGFFVAEGPKIVPELAGLIPEQFHRVYATDAYLAAHPLPDRIARTIVAPHELEKLTHLQTPNGVVALLRPFDHSKPMDTPFSLYLDTIQDPGNFGTILRIADWFGVKQVVCSAGCADLYNPKVVQSTMASIARVHVYYDEDGSWFESRKGPVYAAALDGESLYGLPPFKEGLLLIGNESKGIRPSYLARATHRVTIPRIGGAESLNAAVATGIVLSHLVGKG